MIKLDIEEIFKMDDGILSYIEQISAITWMVLGDGNINHPSGGKNALFQVAHKEECEDYIKFKADILTSITRVSFKKYFHSSSNKYFWNLWTSCHPVFTNLRGRTYLERRKILHPYSIKRLTPLGLAILYQDDGRYAPSKSTISINKPLFSFIELEALAKHIVDTWGIIFRVRRSCKLSDGTIGYELGLRYKDKDKFFSLIEPYIVPSMSYKIGRGCAQEDLVSE